MVAVNQRVRFDVFEYERGNTGLKTVVTGTVVGVNDNHKVFHVEYEVGDTIQRTSFKFCDIGEKVKVV